MENYRQMIKDLKHDIKSVDVLDRDIIIKMIKVLVKMNEKISELESEISELKKMQKTVKFRDEFI